MSIQKDFWYKLEDSLYDEEEEVEKKKEEKYKQFEFEFEDYNITDDLVAPI